MIANLIRWSLTNRLLVLLLSTGPVRRQLLLRTVLKGSGSAEIRPAVAQQLLLPDLRHPQLQAGLAPLRLALTEQRPFDELLAHAEGLWQPDRATLSP